MYVQGAINEDQTLLLLDDELDELNTWDKRTKTFVWDVHSLENPVLKTIFLSEQEAIDHNQYIVSDLVFQVNITVHYIDIVFQVCIAVHCQ